MLDDERIKIEDENILSNLLKIIDFVYPNTVFEHTNGNLIKSPKIENYYIPTTNPTTFELSVDKDFYYIKINRNEHKKLSVPDPINLGYNVIYCESLYDYIFRIITRYALNTDNERPGKILDLGLQKFAEQCAQIYLKTLEASNIKIVQQEQNMQRRIATLKQIVTENISSKTTDPT